MRGMNSPLSIDLALKNDEWYRCDPNGNILSDIPIPEGDINEWFAALYSNNLSSIQVHQISLHNKLES